MAKYAMAFTSLAIGILAYWGSSITIASPAGAYTIGTSSHRLAMLALRAEYAKSVQNMREGAARLLKEYKDQATTDERKKKILSKGISFYLAPQSRDKLFGQTVVIYNGKVQADDHV
jgi:hypothetical protein